MQRQIENMACQNEVKVISDELLNDILRTGLVVTASKGHGKSNAVKIITRELLKRQVAKVKVFDSALNWLFDFSDLQYQLIGENSTLHNIHNCIYDLTLIDDPEYINHIIRQIVSVDYHNHARLKLITNGLVTNWLVYIIEEAQTIIGTSALQSRQNRFWLKAISTGRNIGISFIFVTQRLADVSAKAVERCEGYLIGKMLGDNDLRKLRGIAGKELSWLVKDLAVGTFYYYNGERHLIKFPLFQSLGNAEQYLEPTPKKRTLFDRIFRS